MTTIEHADTATARYELFQASTGLVDSTCAHESVIPASGHGAFCKFCGETLA